MACGKEKFELVLLMLPKACWGGGLGGVGGVGGGWGGWVELE